MASEAEKPKVVESGSQMREEADVMDGSADTIKGKIGELLKNPEFRKTLDSESLRNYEELVRGEGSAKNIDAKTLAGFLKFMKEQFGEIQGIKKRMSEGIAKSIEKGVITEKDREFYQQKIHENVFNGNQIVTKELMEKTERELADSLKKRESERKEYDVIAQNPIVKKGELVVSEKEKIAVPDEKGYLKMSVPERRKLLDQLKKALPLAKKHADKQGGIESEAMNNEYSSLLAKAKKDGLIGTKTEKAAMEKFRQLDNRGKVEWIRDLKSGDHLKRFKDLWADIRKTLKGDSLAKMEKMRDVLGYKDLLTEFGKMKEQEALKLGKEYDVMLDGAHKGKIISKHTLIAFRKDFQGKELDEKRDYVSQFDMQMARYKTLRGKIDGMKDKGAQKTLNGMYESDKYGYTEISEAYEKFSGGKEKSDGAAQLRDVTDVTVKRGIFEARDLLKKQGKEKQGKFLTLLRKMTGGKIASEFNGSNVQSNLTSLRKKGEEKRMEEQKAESQITDKKSDNISSLQDMMSKRRHQAEATANQNADIQNQEAEKEESQPQQAQQIRGQENPLPRVVDRNEIHEQVDSKEFQKDAKVTKEDGYTQVETTDKDNHSVRAAIVEINREKSMKGLDRASQQREFRGERDGGKDKISFSVKTESGKTIELTLQQIRAMEKLIQGDLNNDKEKAA